MIDTLKDVAQDIAQSAEKDTVGEIAQSQVGKEVKLLPHKGDISYPITDPARLLEYKNDSGQISHSVSDQEIVVFRAQPTGDSSIVTGGAFARERAQGATASEANNVRKVLLNKIENPKKETQLTRALGNKSPIISTTKDRELTERRAKQSEEIFGQKMEILTIKGPKSAGVDFNEIFDSLGGRKSRNRATKDPEQQ